jgi:capsular exopolysaccharide synthesis family protein
MKIFKSLNGTLNKMGGNYSLVEYPSSNPVKEPFLKRPFDVLFSFLGLVVLFPAGVIVAIAIYIEDGLPILFSQVRLGENGRKFKIYKFRSMIKDAEQNTGPVWAYKKDHRITKVGDFLRRTKLDELPQLFNILRGDMSFVGPRAERPELVSEFRKMIPGFDYRLRVKPGLTGIAQVYGNYNTHPRNKLRYDTVYINNESFWLDIKLIFATIWFTVEKTFLMDPRSHIAEAFRTIRTSLLLSTPGKPPRSILITSCFPAEGKTTVSINLASSFAQAGSKVLLLEADLRRPRIGNVLGNNGYGLSSYLTGNASLEDVVTHGEIPNMFVLPVGPIPINPAELLGSVQMKELIDILVKEYDYIIVDGPPALGFVDSHILSSLVDGVAVVVRAGKTPRTSIRDLIEKLWNLRANFLGVIVNGIELNQNSYYYKSYNYYYGEGEEKKKIAPVKAKVKNAQDDIGKTI